MKLRIKGNAIRLRLSQQEVEQVAAGEAVSVNTVFPDGQKLTYRFAGHAGPGPAASLVDGVLGVSVPDDQARAWAGGEDVSLRAKLDLPGGDHLLMLVEKDFQCLVPREGEDEAGLYPNPDLQVDPV